MTAQATSSAPVPASDAVTLHVAELERRLRGPARLRRSMVAETRDGLRDAAAAHEDGGLTPSEAAARAVRDFGAVREIAPLYQNELTARQGRRTALLLAVAYPGLSVGWSLLWQSGKGWSEPPGQLVSALARMQDVVSAGVGIAALVALVLTFRRAAPRGLATMIGAIGGVGIVLCGGAAGVMILGSGPGGSPAVITQPITLIAYGVSLGVLLVSAWSVARTLRSVLA